MMSFNCCCHYLFILLFFPSSPLRVFRAFPGPSSYSHYRLRGSRGASKSRVTSGDLHFPFFKAPSSVNHHNGR